MPSSCSLCDHADRTGVDRALVAGNSLRNIAERFGTSPATLHRHKTHLGAAMAKAEETRAVVEVAHGHSARTELEALRTKATHLGNLAEGGKDYRTALQAVRELTRLVELQERLALEARQGSAVDIINHPTWWRLRGVLLTALGPYPEALAAVMRGIESTLTVDG